MNPKDQLDNNELEQNQELPWKEFPETKDNEIVGDLGALETEVKINSIHSNEIFEENVEEIEHIKDEVDAIKKEVLSSKKNKKGEYIPLHSTDESDTLELANEGRRSSAKNIKDNIQKYPWWLWWLIKSIDNRA